MDLDPWGGETWRSSNLAQPHEYTTYVRDSNGGDEADAPPLPGLLEPLLTTPTPMTGVITLLIHKASNRYAYVQNDPVNFVDPSGLNLAAPGWGGGEMTWYVDGILTDCRTAFR